MKKLQLRKTFYNILQESNITQKEKREMKQVSGAETDGLGKWGYGDAGIETVESQVVGDIFVQAGDSGTKTRNVQVGGGPRAEAIVTAG